MTRFFYIFLLAPGLLLSQPVFFEIRFGNNGYDFSRSIKQLADGSIYVLGYSDSGAYGLNDVALTKLTRQGNVLWTKYYGDSLHQFGNYLNLTSDGKFIVTGETSTPSNGLDFLVYKIDTAGNLIWERTYGGPLNESMRHITETSDRGFFITGFSSDTNASNDTYLAKIDSAGNLLWEGWQGGIDNDYGFIAHQLPDKGFIISGDTRSFGNGGYDVNLTRLDSNFNVAWNYYYGDAWQNGCQGLYITTAGKFLSFGETEIFQFSPFDFYIELIDTNGASMWRHTFGGNDADALFSLVETPAGDFVFTGYSNSLLPGPLNLVVGKVDTAGNMLWARPYGGPGIDIGYEIIKSIDNGYLICGHYSDSLDTDFYLLHVDQDGLLTGLNENVPLPRELNAWPNPYADEYRIKLPPEITGDVSLQVFDASGRDVSEVHSYSRSHDILIIRPEAQEDGVYICRILTENGIYHAVMLRYTLGN